MPADLILPNRPTNTKIGPLAEIANRASEFIQQSKSKDTIRAYRADWTYFEFWCQSHGQLSLPATADIVALYVADLAASLKPATITRRISAISQAHQIAGMESPTRAAKVRLVLAGIRRTLGTAQEAKTPVLVDDLKRMIARLPADLATIWKPPTITRRISAISQAHQIAGMESPTRAAKVRLVLAGIRRF